MGMYDYLEDYLLRCPYCGHSNIELQTKDLGNNLDKFVVFYPDNSDLFGVLNERYAQADKQLKFVRAIASCKSPSCVFVSRVHQIISLGYTGHSFRTFHVTYPIVDGIVCAPAEIIDEDEFTVAGAFEDIKLFMQLGVDPYFNRWVKEHSPKYNGNLGLTILMESYFQDMYIAEERAAANKQTKKKSGTRQRR